MMDKQIKDTLAQRDQFRTLCEKKDEEIAVLNRRLGDSPQAHDVQLGNNEGKPKDQIIDELTESLKILTQFRAGLSSKHALNPDHDQPLDYKGGKHIRGLSLVTDENHQEGPDKAEQALQDFIGNDQDQMQSDKLKIFISLSLKHGVPLPKIDSVNEYNFKMASTLQSNRSNNPEHSASAEIDGSLAQSALFQECQNQFTSYLATKLQLEERNRLKTEEQSAMVIEQLGQTMQRIDLDRNKSANAHT